MSQLKSWKIGTSETDNGSPEEAELDQTDDGSPEEAELDRIDDGSPEEAEFAQVAEGTNHEAVEQDDREEAKVRKTARIRRKPKRLKTIKYTNGSEFVFIFLYLLFCL